MALFGSWSRNEQTETSDVDILVDVDPSIGLRFVALAERLESLLDQHVDVVSSRAVKRLPRGAFRTKAGETDARNTR